MKNYFENVLKGFKDEKSQVMLGEYTRMNPDFLLIDVDQDDMPEILFAFRDGKEKYVGVLKREQMVWRLCTVTNQRIGSENGVFALVKLHDEICITPRDIGKITQLKELFSGKESGFIGMIDGKLYYGRLVPRQQEEMPAPGMPAPGMSMPGELQVIDFLQGDVTGSGCINNVYLMGEKPFGENMGLVRNMGLRIEGQDCVEDIEVTFPDGSGYSPTLFLGDFKGNGILDVLVTFYSAPNGGYVYNYIYSFADGVPKLLFDSSLYNEDYGGLVQFMDNYKVAIQTEQLGKTYFLDISQRDQVYLDMLYDSEGRLINPVQGEITGVIAINPADFDNNRIYNLSAVQRITGVDNEDTLGLLETFFRWDPGLEQFEPFAQYVLLLGEPV